LDPPRNKKKQERDTEAGSQGGLGAKLTKARSFAWDEITKADELRTMLVDHEVEFRTEHVYDESPEGRKNILLGN